MKEKKQKNRGFEFYCLTKTGERKTATAKKAVISKDS